jgi:hypothetical protein
MEGDTGVFRAGAAVRAVADDGGDFDGQFVEFGAPEDFVEAVIGFGDEHRGAHAVGQAAEVPVSVKRAAESAETFDEILHIDIEIGGFDFEAGEEFLPSWSEN